MRARVCDLLFIGLVAGGCGGAVESAAGGAGGHSTSSEGGMGGVAATTSLGGSGGAVADGGGGLSGEGGAGGGPGDFPGLLEGGVWLIGWSGGLDHHSWVRFDLSTATQGSIDVLDPECASCTGLFWCEGKGLFSADPPAMSVLLQLPMACNDETTTLTFGPLEATSGYPPSATAHAFVTEENGGLLDAFLFPSDFCAADFSTCPDPFL